MNTWCLTEPINYKQQPVLNDHFNIDHLKTGLKTRALRGASLTIAGSVSSFVVQFGGTMILARLLTPDDFGLVTMVVSLSLLLQNFGGNGFIEAVVQSKEINHEQMSTLFWINSGISFVMAVGFMAAAPLITGLYKEPRLQPIVLVMAVSIFLGGVSNQHMSLLTRNMQFFQRTVNEVGSSVISIVAAIALAWRGWGYWALVAKWIIAPLVAVVGAWILCDWRPGPPSRTADVRPMVRFAMHTYGNFILNYFRRNMDKILIGRSFGTQSLGFYDRAYHLSNMLPAQILGSLNSVSLAAFSRLSDDHEQYRRSYLKVLSILAFIGMPLSAALTLVAPDVILLLLGPQWSEAGIIFIAFGPSIGIAIVYMSHSWLHLSLGTPDRWFRWSIIEFAFTLLSFAIGLYFGPIGVAAAFSVSFYILIAPALWYAGKPVRLTVFSVFSVLWRYYAAALLAGIVCRLMLYEGGFASDIFLNESVLARIAISVLCCISAYLALVIALHGSTRPVVEFIAVGKEMIRKKARPK